MTEPHLPLAPGVDPASPDAWEQAGQLADFTALVDEIHRWAVSAPDWLPFRKARALVEHFEPELRKIQLRSDNVLVVGFIGGTGVGKSTLINALVGERVCRASKEQRPTTTRPEVVCSPRLDLGFLGFGEGQITIHRRDLPLLEHMLLIDCPDPDTQEQAADADDVNHNRDVMRRVLPHCDVMVCVATEQKYRSQIVTEELLRHAPGRCTVFVQSHAVRDDDMRAHWRQTLAEVGFEVPQIFRLDSEATLAAAARGQPADHEFQRFSGLLQHQLANRARHRIQRANVLGLCTWLLARIRGTVESSLPKLVELEQAIVAEQETMRQRIRARLAETLRGSGYLWRAKLLEQIYSKWGWGLLASFFRLLSGLTGLLVWIPLARARTLTQLTVAGAVAAAGAAKGMVDQLGSDRPLAPAGDLGVSGADVAQSRSILEGYALSAQLDAVIQPQVGVRRQQFTQQTLDELATRLQQRLDDAIDAETRQRVASRAGKVHWLLELIFFLLPAYLVGRLGYNFFYQHLWLDQPLLKFDFILYGAAWVVVIGWLLRAFLLAILSLGLRRRLLHVVDQVVSENVLASLSADIGAAIDAIHLHDRELTRLQRELATLQREMGKLSDLNVGLLVRHLDRQPDRSTQAALSAT